MNINQIKTSKGKHKDLSNVLTILINDRGAATELLMGDGPRTGNERRGEGEEKI